MSRRTKIDRRTIADRGTVIEIIRQVEYSGIPPDFILRLRDIQKDLIRYARCLGEEKCRDDYEREAYVDDIFYHCLGPLDSLLDEYGFRIDADGTRFWYETDSSWY